MRRQDIDQTKEWFNYSNSLTPPYKDSLTKAQILLNGTERTMELDSEYLRIYQPLKRHTNIPNSFIYLYSFGLNPEKYQPSGTCNMSRVDNSQLLIETEKNATDLDIIVYAVNYNILRIQCGMGGLAYVN